MPAVHARREGMPGAHSPMADPVAPRTREMHRSAMSPRRPYLPAECLPRVQACAAGARAADRSEEHTSELQSLMRISYAVFCLKKKTTHTTTKNNTNITI